jgi:hypothetical protein
MLPLAPPVVEAGQASTMAALGATVPPRKDTFQALAAQPLTQTEMACRTGLTKRTAFGLVQARLEVEVPPEVIAHGSCMTGSKPRLPMPMCRSRSSRRWSAIGRRWWNGWPPAWTC